MHMIERTVQIQNESYMVVIPKTLANVVGLKAKDKVEFNLNLENKIIVMTTKSKA